MFLIERVIEVFSGILASAKTTFPFLVRSSETYRILTEEYPDPVSARMPEDLPARYRGFLKNDILICSGCGFCSDVCPSKCIKIKTESGSASNVRWVSDFDIDLGKCVFCGLCVEVCPTKSLVHTNEYQGSKPVTAGLIMSFGRGPITESIRDNWAKEKTAAEKETLSHDRFVENPIMVAVKKRQTKGSETPK